MRTHALVGAVVAPFVVACIVTGCSSSSPEGECVGNANGALKVCSAGSTVPGIDVSYYQGTVNWASVKASGKQFAFIRVSDGTNTLDTQFAANWKNAKTAGVIRGTYQFFRPGQDPIAQADLLVAQLAKNGGLQPGDLPPVLDLETVDGVASSTLVARAKTWLAHVESALGIKPIVYTAAFMSGTIGNNFAGWPLWVANYGVTCPNMPSGWTEWAFWQNADNGSVSGIGGGVDTDVFNGSLADLKKLTLQPKDAGAPPPKDAGAPTPADAGTTAEAPHGGTSLGSAMGAGKDVAPPAASTPTPPDPCAP